MPRLFTAIDPSPDVRDQLASYCDARTASFDIRWTPPENYHSTLRFIGEVGDDQTAEVRSVLDDVAAESFTLEPLGLGVLPSRRSPRVLTINLPRTDPMLTLYESVDHALAEAGVDREQRSYRPHLTIGRLKNADPRAVRSFLQSAPQPDLEAFPVDAFILYESTLTPSGAVHEPLSIFDLS